MKKAPFVIAFLIITAFSSFIFIPDFNETVQASVTDPMQDGVLRIVIASDGHVPYHIGESDWSNSVEAMIDADPDIAIWNGDAIDWTEMHGNPFLNHWHSFYRNNNYSFGWGDIDNHVMYSKFNVGNHDGGWGIVSPDSDNYTLYWTLTLGNLMIIGLGDWSPYENNYTDRTAGGEGYFMPHRQWVNDTIQANSDKNIMFVCHYGLADTCGLGSTAMSGENDTYYKAMFNWFNDSGDPIDMFVFGHAHRPSSAGTVFDTYGGTQLIHNLAISTSDSNDGSCIAIEFTNDSTTYTVKAMDTDGRSGYIENGNYPNTFDMTYAFNYTYDLEPESDPEGLEWNTINAVSQNGTLYNTWRNYSGEKFANSTYYQIQVSNSSDCSNPFIIFNANESLLGSDYMETDTYFYANDTKSFEDYGGQAGRHYYRYRSRYRVVTE